MENNKNDIGSGVTIGMLGQISNELCMIKAMQYVQLEFFAKENNIELEPIIKRVDQMFAQYIFDLEKKHKDIINKALDPDESDLKI